MWYFGFVDMICPFSFCVAQVENNHNAKSVMIRFLWWTQIHASMENETFKYLFCKYFIWCKSPVPHDTLPCSLHSVYVATKIAVHPETSCSPQSSRERVNDSRHPRINQSVALKQRIPFLLQAANSPWIHSLVRPDRSGAFRRPALWRRVYGAAGNVLPPWAKTLAKGKVQSSERSYPIEL